MGWIDFVIIGVIVLIVGGAAAYVIKAKKSGKKCIGCPDGGACSKKCDGSTCSCGCGGSDEQKPSNQ
ncbi:MAG: FeoB-associated Cys-rich membrane protein [Clostridia bacterium]|nr:FeoB-associated Cys-rich membrane protein [Clostridia bacterium]